MIGSLTGTATLTHAGKTLIEVQGVGYWVHTGTWLPFGEVRAFIYQHVREDALDLYGFATLDHLGLFEKLISISGIGPKAGLSLLSLGTASELHAAIESSDVKYLSKAPGIGQKAAQKVILELKGKLVETELAGTPQGDLAEALEQLGYRRAEIQPIIAKAPKELSLEKQLSWALRQL